MPLSYASTSNDAELTEHPRDFNASPNETSSCPGWKNYGKTQSVPNQRTQTPFQRYCSEPWCLPSWSRKVICPVAGGFRSFINRALTSIQDKQVYAVFVLSFGAASTGIVATLSGRLRIAPIGKCLASAAEL